MDEYVLSDEELLLRAADGDGEALGSLYDRHGNVLFGLAMRLLQHRDDAADLVHDVFLESWQKARQYDAERATVRSWLILRLRSRAIDRVRARDVRAAVLAQPPPEEVECAGSVSPDQDRIGSLLSELSESHRTVLTLSYFKGLSCQEIASHTRMPVSTIKSRLRTATLRLGELLGGRPEVEC
jgi:RNA polymerase sigma-70 factor (ECF subfamily)